MKWSSNRTCTVTLAGLVLSLVAVACGSGGIEGTYSNGGPVMLELRSGGKADLTMMGEIEHCTWKSDEKQILLTCKGEALTFNRHDDGSLTGPPGSFIPTLKKEK